MLQGPALCGDEPAAVAAAEMVAAYDGTSAWPNNVCGDDIGGDIRLGLDEKAMPAGDAMSDGVGCASMWRSSSSSFSTLDAMQPD